MVYSVRKFKHLTNDKYNGICLVLAYKHAIKLFYWAFGRQGEKKKIK